MLYVVVVVVDNDDGFWPRSLSLSLSFRCFRGFDLVRFGEVVGVVMVGWLVNTTMTIYYDYDYDYLLTKSSFYSFC